MADDEMAALVRRACEIASDGVHSRPRQTSSGYLEVALIAAAVPVVLTALLEEARQ